MLHSEMCEVFVIIIIIIYIFLSEYTLSKTYILINDKNAFLRGGMFLM